MATIGSKARQFWHHPAGPKTIHFWAPTFKWGISIANIADFKRPPEQVSYPQQIAVTATGVIWSRFATQITPVSACANMVVDTVCGHTHQGKNVCLQSKHSSLSCRFAGQLQPTGCELLHGVHWLLPTVTEDQCRQSKSRVSRSSH